MARSFSKNGDIAMKTTTLVLSLGIGVAACSGGHAGAPSPAQGAGSTAPAATAVAQAHPRGGLPPGYMRVPNGVALHGDCVHEVPSGGKVHANGDVTVDDVVVAHHDACAQPAIVAPRPTRADKSPAPTHETPGVGGWVEAAWQWAPSGQQFVVSTSTFVVPSEPTTKLDPLENPGGQLIFLFPAVTAENSSDTASAAIVQPVLQWGNTSPNGGITGVNGTDGGSIGNSTSWTYSAWGVVGESGYFSNPLTVNVGDTLQANMEMFAQSSSSVWWTIEAIDQTTGASSWEYVEFNVGNDLWASAQAGVLEAYEVGLCSDFPASSTIFQYPNFEMGSFGTFEGSGVTSAPASSSGWISFLPGSAGGYTGPSCGFNATIAATSFGTTLAY